MNWLNVETYVFIPDAGSWGFITVTCAEGVWLQCNCAYYAKNTADTNTHSAQALGQWLQKPALQTGLCPLSCFEQTVFSSHFQRLQLRVKPITKMTVNYIQDVNMKVSKC